MDSGVLTGIITVVVLGSVIVWILLASKKHDDAKRKRAK